MNDRQENKFTMYLTVRLVLTKFAAVWAALQAFVDVVSDFDDVIEAIGDDRQGQEKDTKGITDDKGESKEKLIIKTMEVIGAVVAYASRNNNNELLEKVNYSESELRDRTRDTILVDKCQLVHDEADAIIGSLNDFGVVPQDLTDLQGLIDDYTDRIPAPRAAIGERSSATESLEEDFEVGDKLLEEQLDGLMENFRTSNSDFYQRYQSARKIIPSGRRTTNLEGVVTDAETGDPVQGATIELVDREETTTTDRKGVYRLETLLPGEDLMRVSKEGWITQEIDVDIERGKTVVVDVALVKEVTPPPTT